MKTIEEKAKRYDEALSWGEDERIREELLEHCRKQAEMYNTLQTAKEYSEVQSWISWLEKQCEQKPADIERLLQTEYKKGWDEALRQLPQEVDTQIWQIACRSAKTWEESFAILNATQKAYDKGKKDALKVQPNAWSEEDERMLDFAIRAIGLCRPFAINHQIEGYAKMPDAPAKYKKLQDWLKARKDRYTWKPSDEQMNNK